MIIKLLPNTKVYNHKDTNFDQILFDPDFKWIGDCDLEATKFIVIFYVSVRETIFVKVEPMNLIARLKMVSALDMSIEF